MRTHPILTTVTSTVTFVFVALFLACLPGIQTADAATAKATSTTASTGKKSNAAGKKKSASGKASKVITGKAFGNSRAVKELSQEIALQQQLPLPWVQQQLAQARLLPQILQLVLPPVSVQQKNWNAYRARFLTECRIQAGVQFWREHALVLDQAHQRYGVEPRFIVGILGVETFFGQHKGQYKLLDALTTLSLNFPSSHSQAQERQAFFQNELGFFLKQQRAQPNRTPVLGSYAGASGWPQFMPSSIAKFAVDFDGDGRIDLFGSRADAIGSVANYLAAFHWKPGMPTHYAVQLDPQTLDLPALLQNDIVPSMSPLAMRERGAELDEAGQRHPGLLALIELPNGSAPTQYVAGTDNFYTVTRYNWSSFYAMSVIELGHEVQTAWQRDSAAVPAQAKP